MPRTSSPRWWRSPSLPPPRSLRPSARAAAADQHRSRSSAKPAEALVGIVTLGHQIGYNNILSVYAVLLLLAPTFLHAGQHQAVAGARGSRARCGWRPGLFQIAPPNYPEPGFWFINPLSWQFLFNIGMVGMDPRPPWRRHPGQSLAGRWARHCFVVGLARLGAQPAVGQGYSGSACLSCSTGFDKTLLSLPRLLHILSVSYLIIAIPAVSRLARRRADHPLAILGKRSLPVFIAGTMIAMVAQVMKLVNAGGIAYDALLIATGIIMQFALAYFIEWLSAIGMSGKKATAHRPRRSANHGCCRRRPRRHPQRRGKGSDGLAQPVRSITLSASPRRRFTVYTWCQ